MAHLLTGDDKQFREEASSYLTATAITGLPGRM